MQKLKKVIAVAIIMIVLLAYSITTTIAVTKTKGKVITDTLRLRQEASLESTVVELLYKDDEVEIVAEEGDWYKVNFKTYTGYVSKEYISKENSNTNENKNEETNNTTSGENNNNTNNSVNNENTNTTTSNTENKQNEENSINQLANKQATINSDINVYILPLINSNIIGNLKQNRKVNIINVTGVWAYIKTDDLAGWIRVDKVSIDNNITTNNNSESQNDNGNNNTEDTKKDNNETNSEEKNNNTEETTTKKEYTAKNYYIKSSAVNVRSKASTSSDVVTTLTQNTQVKTIAEEGDWYKVEVSGKTGYILKSLLSENKVEVTSRSATQGRKTSNQNNQGEEATTYNSSKGEQIVAYAKKYLGCKYVYAGSGPSTFDCSGFTMYVYKNFGYSLGHSAVTQAKLGKYVSRSNLQPGDLVIFNNSANTSIGHVGIYIGGGNFIHASSGGGKVMISSLSGAYYNTRYVTARRIV